MNWLQNLSKRDKDSMLKLQKIHDFTTKENIKQLRQDGFIKLENCVDEKLCDDALREINRRLGFGASADSMKAKTFLKDASITNLFNKSIIPDIIQTLFGEKKKKNSKYKQGAGQIALRFPGDLTPNQTAKASSAVFRNVSMHWHIDGCPNEFIPGVTDHYGHINNFDMLVGVLLSDIYHPMSGELCCWPGSHHKLADYFTEKNGQNLENVYTHGNQALPTGKKTFELFKIDPVHCVGKKGDVFLANYMTAHFIAPNTSPNIRYAVYFRVSKHGIQRKLPNGKHNPASMLAPWLYWFDDGDATKRDNKNNNNSSNNKSNLKKQQHADIPNHLMPSEEEMQLMKFYEQNSNNDHTIPKSLQRNNSSGNPITSDSSSDDSRFGQKYDNNKKQDAETMKVAIVLSMLQEMGINDKTSDDVLAALMNHNMDENNALDSFFS